MEDFKTSKPVIGAPAMGIVGDGNSPDQEPCELAGDYSEGTRLPNRTGQLFEVKNGKWEKVS